MQEGPWEHRMAAGSRGHTEHWEQNPVGSRAPVACSEPLLLCLSLDQTRAPSSNPGPCLGPAGQAGFCPAHPASLPTTQELCPIPTFSCPFWPSAPHPHCSGLTAACPLDSRSWTPGSPAQSADVPWAGPRPTPARSPQVRSAGWAVLPMLCSLFLPSPPPSAQVLTSRGLPAKRQGLAPGPTSTHLPEPPLCVAPPTP